MAEVKVGSKAKGREVILQWDAPATLDDALESWGEAKVFDLVLRQASTDVKNLVRPQLDDAEMTDEKLQELVNEYSPGARRSGAGSRSKSAAKMSIEELEALIAAKKAELAGQ
jgi:hypothetical protein